MIYKLLGNTGLRVSELCLGTMTFGTDWNTGADKAESQKMFEKFVEAGGNFFDTANRYTEGTSERFLGEFIKADRDRYVIASKYTLYDKRDDVNAMGNHRKNLMRSLDHTLKRLQTDYLDLLWVHMWDFTTPIEEVMRGLDDVVRSGKVHYIGISDTPAWVVAKANTLAEGRGWTKFSALQIEWSLIERTVERDLIPMAKHFGLAVTPWSPLGAGLLTGKYNAGMQGQGRLSEKSVKYTPHNIEIAKKVSEVAQKLGATSAQVALAWLRQQGETVFPILGARSAAQLEDAMGCLSVEIPADLMNDLHQASQIDLGFPHKFLETPGVQDVIFGDFKETLKRQRRNF